MVDRRKTKDSNLVQFLNVVIEYLKHESKGTGAWLRRDHRKYTISIPNVIPNVVFEEIDKYLPI